MVQYGCYCMHKYKIVPLHTAAAEIVSLTPTAFFPRRAATTKDIVLEEEESDE